MLYTPEMIIFIFSAAIIIALITITLRRFHYPCGHAFLLFMLCALVWTVTFTLEIAVQTLELKIFFVKLQFIAICILPLAWFHLIMSYTGQVISRIIWVLISIIPIITICIVWFVPRPNWFWKNPKIVSDIAPLPLLDYDYGIWFYYVHVPYSYLILLAALIILILTFFKTHLLYRNQILMMLFAIILPVVSDIIYVLGYSPISYLNLTTAIFSISCLIIALALFRYSFLDLLPMARDLVIDNMDDAVIVLDVKNRLLDANPSAVMITGISTHDIGRPLREITSELSNNIIEDISRGGKKQIEVKIGKSEEKRVFDLHLSIIKNRLGQIQGSVLTLRDYTEKANLFNQIQKQATYDSLTGIFNRAHLIALGQKEMNRINRNPEICSSVIMMDIDNFKDINDGYGHTIGDQVLIAFVEQCKDCIRPYDIFGRLGGDEFVIFLPETILEDAIDVAGRIKKNIEQMRVATTQGNISITLSLGVVSTKSIDSKEYGLEQLFSKADEQMYRSKNQGRNKVSYI